MRHYTATIVESHPVCDYCKQSGSSDEAEFDGKTVDGPWANMCNYHYGAKGVGLGMGQGQQLYTQAEWDEAQEDEDEDYVLTFEDFEEMVGDGDPAEYF